MYHCSGICQPTLFWVQRSVDEGVPKLCLDVFYEDYSSGITWVGAFLIFTVCAAQFTSYKMCGLCKTPVPDDYSSAYQEEQKQLPA